MSKVRHINDGDLKNLLYHSDPFAVAFMSYMSIPCGYFAPELYALPELMNHRLKFFYLDVDENPDITERMGVTAIPTLLLMRGKVEVAKYEGPYKKEALCERIVAALSNKKKS